MFDMIMLSVLAVSDLTDIQEQKKKNPVWNLNIQIFIARCKYNPREAGPDCKFVSAVVILY